MRGEIVNALLSVVTALIGLAALSVFLSKNANTTAVISSGSSAVNSGIGAAIAPITGGNFSFGNGMSLTNY